MENVSNRRSKVSATEVEYQTHIKVNVEIKNEKDEIIKSHKSFGYVGDIPNTWTETTDITSVRPALLATPTRWHQELLSTSGANINNPNACCVYLSTDDKSSWLGCSYKNKVTQQRDCN